MADDPLARLSERDIVDALEGILCVLERDRPDARQERVLRALVAVLRAELRHRRLPISPPSTG